MKIKTSCVSKNTMKKVKRQTLGWKKIFANDFSNKGLISRIYKEFVQTSNKKTT